MSKNVPLVVVDRVSKKPFEETVWGDRWLRFLYGDTILSKSFGRLLLHLLVRWPLFSWIIGKYYTTARSRRLIAPFCERFSINTKEQTLPLDAYNSFNDFFTRRLRPECRPQDPSPSVVTIPADGRYTFIPTLDEVTSVCVKGQFLSLPKLLGCSALATRFYGGVGVICRLCPADYHRFFFPVEGRVGRTAWIHGPLFSVSPMATTSFPWIFWTNRRMLTPVDIAGGSMMAYIEVGATNCGSIIQEFVQNSWVKKGQEKGFFQLGGSAIILLFEPGVVHIEPDLLTLAESGHEVFCQIGQPLARFCGTETV